MKWTDNVTCACGAPINWHVVDGEWTCHACGRHMTSKTISDAHTCNTKIGPRCWCEDDERYEQRTMNK